VVIPIYKSYSLLGYEDILGLRSAFEHFKDEHICFVAPEFLSTEAYETLAEEYDIYVEWHRFNNKYFLGKDSYSRLLVSNHFYNCFRDYKFMLICQTDVFVFHNSLKEWMARGFTYIGAPWVVRNELGEVMLTGAGNGGFSLRKISDFIRLTNKINHLQKLFSFWQSNKMTRKIPFGMFLRICAAPVWLDCKINKYTFYLAGNRLQHEDKYWCEWVAKVFIEFKNAPSWLSSRFAIEEEPRHFMQELAGDIPMGCHAWAIIDPVFWKQYIKVS
jgi:hypothetical protein